MSNACVSHVEAKTPRLDSDSVTESFNDDSPGSTTALVIYRPMPKLLLTTDNRAAIKNNLVPNMILDVVPAILSFCDAPTVSRASCVCREWHSIALNNDLWENLCRSCFGVSAQEIKPSPDPTKQLYVLTHRRLRQLCRQVARSPGANLFSPQPGSLPSIPVAALRP